MNAYRDATLEQAAQVFPVGSSALLEARSLTDRIDYKFGVPVDQLAGILDGLVGTHAVVVAGDRRVATYRTRYFDTDTLTFFHDHRRRRPRRLKIRRRRYEDRDLDMFEIKLKDPRGGTRKLRWETAGTTGPLTGRERTLVREHTPIDPDTLVPTLGVDVHRLMLLGIDVHERLTIDTGLQFSLGDDNASVEELAIVEIKTRRELRPSSPSLRLLTALHHRPRGLSKYCLGVRLLSPTPNPAWFSKLTHQLLVAGAIRPERLHALPCHR